MPAICPLDHATPGPESKAAADLIAERFPGATGDTIEVVAQAPSGIRAPAVQERMETFLVRASRLEGIGEPGPTRVSGPTPVSRDGAIALSRLDLDRRAWDVATAILVDATIVRMVLVPAVMQLLGRANWWIPRWLNRILPRVDGPLPAALPAHATGERRAA